MKTTYQERIAEAIRRAGNKSALARRVREATQGRFSVQSIQHLARVKAPKGKTKDWKPAKGSRFDVYIAEAVGLSPTWLTTGRLPMDKGSSPNEDFASVMSRKMAEIGLAAHDVADALNESLQEVERYLQGTEMPKSKSMKKLATLLGMPVEQLQHPGLGGPLPDTVAVSLMELDADQRKLVEIYARLKPWGQKALMRRAVELEEEFLAKSKSIPFGRGTQ